MLIYSHDCAIDKLQWIQNVTAKMIGNLQRSDSATETSKTLHWLPKWARIEFKILLLVYKCLNNSVLVYLQDLLQNNEYKGVSNSLRSKSTTLL